MRGPADALLFGWGPLSYVKSFSYKPGPNVANNNLRVPLVDLRLAIAMELQKVAWEAVQKREITGSN